MFVVKSLLTAELVNSFICIAFYKQWGYDTFMNGKAKSFWKSDATKYIAVLYIGILLGRSSLPYFFAVPIEIMGFASIIIVLVNFIKSKLHKAQ